MGRPKKLVEENLEPVVGVFISSGVVAEDNSVTVQLKDGSIVTGTKVTLNGQEHVELVDSGVTWLVHKSPNGEWYEV